jgi:hypothetical protein
MSAYNNKNLIVHKGIVLNADLDGVLSDIDSYWEGRKEKVTSAIRTIDDQLRIIRDYMVDHGLDKKYPDAMTCDVRAKFPNMNFYKWQMPWSTLLNIGVIINPPIAAKCLLDYWKNGVNKKDTLIGQSPHTKGKSFDISGLDSLDIIKRLLADKKIKGYLIERKNNCIHIDI